ncbi:877_t:CDS:2, partial [Ambispora gerdemannii]
DQIWTTAKRYREGIGTKKCLVGEKIYDDFSTKFWLKPELPFEQVRNENVSRTSSHETSAFSISPERPKGKSSSEQPLEKAVETPNISRPVTPTLPSFSQNVNVINVTFNYGGAQIEED